MTGYRVREAGGINPSLEFHMSSPPVVLHARIQRVIAGSALAALALMTPGLTPANAATVTTTATVPSLPSLPSGLVKTGTTIPKTNYTPSPPVPSSCLPPVTTAAPAPRPLR